MFNQETIVLDLSNMSHQKARKLRKDSLAQSVRPKWYNVHFQLMDSI